MTLVIGIAIPIGALIYSNARITDAKETLRSEIKALESSLRGDMNLGFERISNQIRELKDAIHIHEVEHHQK
jgi:prefoldin subunit 5